MSLLLAPYNDSMRLGMGYNSYTQTKCIDGAVEVTETENAHADNPSQTVTYSSKFLERLSDIVSSMNISYSAAIKKGTIEVSGNGNSIDEDKIKASDINLVVAVQVINQTTTLKDSASFVPIEGIAPGSNAFNDAFGDCYISGFIEGGDFNSIISMRSLDRTKTSSVVRSIKKAAKGTEPDTFTLDSRNFSSTFSTSEALKEVETTISVNWMGGGQIKDPQAGWDIDSVYSAAASFPSFVAKTPQRTWAILTKYKANRSFSSWATSLSLRPLEYDAVISYTAELFNNYMEYKQLVKKVQDIISNGDQYQVVKKTNAIPIEVGVLVAVRSALRTEMNKIVAVVNLLSRRPDLLSQDDSFEVESKNALVRKIVSEAISTSPGYKSILSPSIATPSHLMAGEAGEHEPSPNLAPEHKIDLSALVAPEVWAELLPEPILSRSINQDDSAAKGAASSQFPPAPPNDAAVQFLGEDPTNLKILVAVCGIHDVTSTLQAMVKDSSTLTIPINAIDGLAQNAVYSSLTQPFIKSLSFVYQYGSGPMYACSAKYDPESTASISVTAKTVAKDVAIKLRPWQEATWSIAAVVYGSKIFTDEAHLISTEIQLAQSHNRTVGGKPNREAWLTNITMKEDPWFGITKTAIIFYASVSNGPLQAAVALEWKPCILTDQPQLAEVSRDIGTMSLRDDLRHVVNSEPRYSCSFGPGSFHIEPSDIPFLTFENNIHFFFLPNGNFCVMLKDEIYWETGQKGGFGKSLTLQDDGNVVANVDNGMQWATGTGGHYGARLVLSSTKPFVEVFNSNSERVFS